MKRVIVQILPAEASSSENPSDPSAEFRARQEVIPITGDDERADVSSAGADSVVRVEAVVSAERARSVVDTVLNVSEPASVDSFEKMIDFLIQRELDTDESGELFHRVMSSVEKALVEKAFVECGRVQTRTADRLGVNRNTIHKKLLKHELLDLDEELSPEGDGQVEQRRCI